MFRSSELWWSESLSLVQRECLGKQLSPTIGNKWQWVLTEVAQFCVENRLKTPFGKPLETFLQFESASYLSRGFYYNGKFLMFCLALLWFK